MPFTLKKNEKIKLKQPGYELQLLLWKLSLINSMPIGGCVRDAY